MTDVLPSSSTFTERPGAEPEVFARDRREPDEGLPPIDDPFLRPEGRALIARATERPRLSRRALASLSSALLLAPKAQSPLSRVFSRIELHVDGKTMLLRRLLMVEQNGDEKEVIFGKLDRNIELPASQFQ